MEKHKLYFCNGTACEDDKKTVCYLQGECCHHTPKPEHAISKLDPNFPPTHFIPFGKTNLLIEEFDEEAIFKKLGEGGGMVISNKVKQLI